MSELAAVYSNVVARCRSRWRRSGKGHRQVNAVIHSPASDAPFDYAAIGDVPDWRERLTWPLSYSAQFGLGQSLSQRIVETISKQGDPDLQRIALMAAGSIFASCLPILETCLMFRF